MKYFRIKNFAHYQHYKDRNPPWIKLHAELLTSRTWVTLDDASRVLAVACMVLASRTENKIPLDADYLRRVAYLNGPVDIAPLIAADFVEVIENIDSASTVLADASKTLAVARPETETYREEAETEKRKTLGANAPEFEVFWKSYPRRGSHPNPKKPALQKFTAAIKRGVDPKTIIAAAKAFAAAERVAGRDPKFIPQAVTWLSQERWADVAPKDPIGTCRVELLGPTVTF